eukprot:symbB.v1.2.034721.t1/scaffold4535.1/size38356/3
MLAAVQRGMVVAQRSISEVKESLLMVLDGHSGAKREVEELRLSIKLIADRVSAQEAAVSSVQKDMDQVCSSLQERIDKAETSSQRVTGLFQELRKDMARLLAEEPKVDSVNLQVVEAPDRQRSTGSDLSQETVSQSCSLTEKWKEVAAFRRKLIQETWRVLNLKNHLPMWRCSQRQRAKLPSRIPGLLILGLHLWLLQKLSKLSNQNCLRRWKKPILSLQTLQLL